MKKEFDRAIDKYAKTLYRISYMILKSKIDAEDVVQETFLRYLLNTKKFKSDEHEKNWLIRVNLNICKNLLNSAWRKHTVPIDNNCLNLEDEEKERVIEELEKLEEKYRVVVQLFYYEDLSVKTISQILNITETNVRTRLNRARKELKIEIEKERNYYKEK